MTYSEVTQTYPITDEGCATHLYPLVAKLVKKTLSEKLSCAESEVAIYYYHYTALPTVTQYKVACIAKDIAFHVYATKKGTHAACEYTITNIIQCKDGDIYAVARDAALATYGTDLGFTKHDIISIVNLKNEDFYVPNVYHMVVAVPAGKVIVDVGCIEDAAYPRACVALHTRAELPADVDVLVRTKVIKEFYNRLTITLAEQKLKHFTFASKGAESSFTIVYRIKMGYITATVVRADTAHTSERRHRVHSIHVLPSAAVSCAQRYLAREMACKTDQLRVVAFTCIRRSGGRTYHISFRALGWQKVVEVHGPDILLPVRASQSDYVAVLIPREALLSHATI